MGDNTTDFSSRVLCSDGTCIGVIGSDGKCKECGKPFENIDDTLPENENISKTKNAIYHVSVDEKGFKCKTCGFIAFGDDLYTAEHKKCLGCGNIMGQEPIKKQPSSSSDSLLETCQNCKHQFSKRASLCPKCQQERTSPCFVCKKQIPKSSKSCPECGDPAPFEHGTGKSESHSTKTNNIATDFNQKHHISSGPENTQSSNFLYTKIKTEKNKDFDQSMPHPWHRFWARSLDYAIFLTLSHVLAVFITFSTNFWVDLIVWLFITCIALLTYDAFWVSAVATSPGKALFGIKVLNNDGSKLTFGQSFSRAYSVLAKGFGFLIFFPFIPMICMWSSYKIIKNNGIASWDESAGYKVVHNKVGSFRIFTGIVLGVIAVTMIGVVHIAVKQMAKESIKEQIFQEYGLSNK
jgi:uncharacterized RDD family membrane protein YckC